MMDLQAILSQKCSSIHQLDDGGISLVVKDNEQYRWFEYGGSSTQSLMDKASPEKILMPVYQSLLLFLLFKKTPLNILNLGLGGASIERALTRLPHVELTSIDASQAIINMAKKHFKLPPQVTVFCADAELFIQQTKCSYDVVLCDLFIGEKSPAFLFQQDFYQQLSNITNNHAVLMINLKAQTEGQLLQALLFIKKRFPYIVLMEFDDYINIVIMASKHEIPAKILLQQNLKDFSLVDFTGFIHTSLEQTIKKMRYVPSGKN